MARRPKCADSEETAVAVEELTLSKKPGQKSKNPIFNIPDNETDGSLPPSPLQCVSYQAVGGAAIIYPRSL